MKITLAQALVWAVLLWPPASVAAVLDVPSGFATIQQALDAAQPGDEVVVAAGVYFEKIQFPRSGLPGAPIILRAAAGAQPILDGTGVLGENMVLIDSKSHLRLVGFEIRNHTGVADGSGVRILGSGRDLEVRDNVIHDIRGTDAMGITVYGTEALPLEELVIDGNTLYDLEPAQSEALTLNGNVRAFEITGNLVRDVNNIGIDMIGGETDIQPDPSLVAREGLVRGNTVLRANANYEGGYAGGIYVDGGRDIVIENNRVAESDLGIEIGAENAGQFTEDITVRNNVFHHNERAGMVFGGFEAAVGRTRGCTFRGNTLYGNNTVGESGQGTYFVGGGVGEIWMQYAEDNTVVGNLVQAGAEEVLVASFDAGSATGNVFEHNLYWSPAGAGGGEFSLNGNFFTGLGAWRAGTGNDLASLEANPLLVGPEAEDFHLAPGSPAIDAGDPAYLPAAGEADLDGAARRVGSAVEIGADELDGGVIFTDGFESGTADGWDASLGS